MPLSLCPVLPFAVAFMLGIIFNGTESSPLWVSVPLALCALFIILRRHYISILSLAIALGFMVSEAHRPLKPGFVSDGGSVSMSFSGVVKEHREYDGARVLIVGIDSCGLRPAPRFIVKAVVPSMIPPADEADRIRFNGSLRPLDSRLDLPDEIDYNAPYRVMGVVAECFIHPDSICCVTPEPGIVSSIRRYRRDVQARIAVLPLSSGAREFLMAALTGDRSWIVPSTRELFSSTGIAHILALSGLHVGILSAVIMIMLFPLTAFGMRRCSMILAIVSLWLFAILTGLSPSVVRAVVMATLFLVTTMLQRLWSPLNALAIAALVILIFTPAALYTLGFQLTFLAVLSIIMFARRLNPFGYRHPVLRAMAGCVTVSVAAMLGTGMVSAFHFHIFPSYFMVTNIAVSLLLPLILGSGMLLLALDAVGCTAAWLGSIVDTFYGMMMDIAGYIATLPGSSFSGLWIPQWVMAMYFVLLLLFALWLYGRRVVMLCAMAVVTLFIVLWSFIPVPDNNATEVYITRSSTETTMLVRDRDTLLSFTTARPALHGEVMERSLRKYSSYMLRRVIPDIVPLEDGAMHGQVRRQGSLVSVSGATFLFLASGIPQSHTLPASARITYAVVCRGFTADVRKLASGIRPDTILLSADLDRRRHDRYCRELTAASIPHRSLRTAPFSTSYPPSPPL